METLEATTLMNDTTVLPEEVIHGFVGHLRGPLIRPGGDGYDDARAIPLSSQGAG